MIAAIESASERAAVFAFRYEVIVREQGITSDPAIDHLNGSIRDPADDTGVILAAWVDGDLAGTVRCNLLRDGPAQPFCGLLGLCGLPDSERCRVSVSSRLMVGSRWRGTPLGIHLSQACHRYYRAAGLAWDYIVVRPALISFYGRLGYTPAGPSVDFPGVGCLTPLRINLDPASMRRVGTVLIADSD